MEGMAMVIAVSTDLAEGCAQLFQRKHGGIICSCYSLNCHRFYHLLLRASFIFYLLCLCKTQGLCKTQSKAAPERDVKHAKCQEQKTIAAVYPRNPVLA